VRRPQLLAIGAIAVVVVACSSPAASPSTSAAAVVSTAPSEAASVAPTIGPSATPNACDASTVPTLITGTLTIGTDNPAYPPYFAENANGNKTAPWELGDPTNGKGFESAFAYDLATTMGFRPNQVVWTYVTFDNSYAPGTKPFDLDINQISNLPGRSDAVDLSDGYYFVNQAVVSMGDNPIAAVTTVSGLAAFKFGAQTGTTSYKTITDVIKPTAEASVYSTNDAAIAALNAKQIDAIVVDLPTAFYMASAQITGGKVVGQFAAPSGADAEHFSVALEKGSALTPCVNAAIATMTANGRLASITQEWLVRKVSAPLFTP